LVAPSAVPTTATRLRRNTVPVKPSRLASPSRLPSPVSSSTSPNQNSSQLPRRPGAPKPRPTPTTHQSAQNAASFPKSSISLTQKIPPNLSKVSPTQKKTKRSGLSSQAGGGRPRGSSLLNKPLSAKKGKGSFAKGSKEVVTISGGNKSSSRKRVAPAAKDASSCNKSNSPIRSSPQPSPGPSSRVRARTMVGKPSSGSHMACNSICSSCPFSFPVLPALHLLSPVPFPILNSTLT